MPPATEKELRSKLGIPDDAKRVLLFAESSHFDPDWLVRSKTYYYWRMRRVISKAIKECLKNPRRVYSFEGLFFVKMYLERHPDKFETVRELVKEGRIRFSGVGITEPDTLLPEAESIIRDFKMGYDWLNANGLQVEPRVAYFPDNFGHSPMLPSLLNSMGICYTAASRVDGLYFIGMDYDMGARYPLAGSSAELLFKKLMTTDIVWEAPDGSEVLFHINPKTYGHGDLIAYRGMIRVMGINLVIPTNSLRVIKRRVASYVKNLEPYAKTPYMLCVIGFDFNKPIPRLVSAIDLYNRKVYPTSGVYCALGALEDYMDLLSHYRSQLPRLTLDPTPHWMGFYFSRPWLKEQCRATAARLVAAEKLYFKTGVNPAADPDAKHRWRRAWDVSVFTNHHDFITGTSTNRVYKGEQIGLVKEASLLSVKLIDNAAARAGVKDEVVKTSPPDWALTEDLLTIASPYYLIYIDRAQGGCITSWIDVRSKREVVASASNDVLVRRDHGGLWRLGHEFLGGSFRKMDKLSKRPAFLHAREISGALEVTVSSKVGGKAVIRRLWFVRESPLIWLRTIGRAGEYRILTSCFRTTFRPKSITMSVPGGVVARPLKKVYDPTFWAAGGFVHYHDEPNEIGLALFAARPLAPSGDEKGVIEWPVVRNARQEIAFGFLTVPAHPSWGRDRSEQTFDVALCVTGPGDWRANRLHLLIDEANYPVWRDARLAAIMKAAAAAVTVDNEDVRVLAVLPSQNPAETVIRLQSFAGKPVTVAVAPSWGRVKSAIICDALERERSAATISDGKVVVPMDRNIVSVRVAV